MTPSSPRARRRAAPFSALAAAAVGSLLVVAAPSPALAAPTGGSTDPRGVVRIVDVEEYDYDADGLIDSTATSETLLDGRGLIRSSDFTIVDSQGAVIQYSTSAYTYDDRGRLTLVTFEQGDASGPFVIEYVEQEYTSRNEVSRVLVTTDLGGDGSIDETREQINEGSPRSLGTSSTDSFDLDGDGVSDVIRTRESTLDRRGNLLTEVVSVDEGADGTIDSVVSSTRTYTTRGSLLTDITTDTANGTATVTSVALSYDARGQVTGYVQVQGGDDAETTAVLLRDGAGRLISVTESVDQGRDGSIDEVRETAYEYDAQGRESRIEFRQTVLGFPDLGISQVTLVTYSPAGEVTSYVSAFDLADDGVIDGRSSTISTLDARGRVLRSVVTQENGDGSIEFRQTDTFTYGRDGQLATALSETDFGGDGVIDSVRTYTRTVS